MVQALHAYSHPGINKTIELNNRRYELHNVSAKEFDDLVPDVILRCDKCATLPRVHKALLSHTLLLLYVGGNGRSEFACI